ATNVQGVLREGGRTASEGRQRARLRSALVVAEPAIPVVLVIGAALMARSFARLMAVDPGFSAARVISFGVTLQSELFEGDPETAMARRNAYRDRMLATLRALPGVVAVAASKTMPLAAGGEPLAFSSERGGESDLQPEGG